MEKITALLMSRFAQMCETGMLFRAQITGSELWELYLSSFPDGMDPIFRDPTSSTHNCNQCNNFMRRYSNIIALDSNYNIMTIFDIATDDDEYMWVMQELAAAVKKSAINSVFFETFDELKSLPYEQCKKNQEQFQLGVAKQVKRYTKEEAELYGVVKPNEVRTFHHLHLFLPKQFVDFSGKSIEAIIGNYRDKYSVFKRAMEEISLDTLSLVRDLILQGSLLDGDAHLPALESAITAKKAYDQVASKDRDNYLWATTYTMSERVAKFKNTLIGVLCTELAEGEELNKACQNWNKRVDPVNYMKAVAPITKAQIEEAKKFVEENGYEESFDRRFATIDDIKVSEILHSNVGDGSVKTVSMFDNVKSKPTRHKRNQFDGLETVSIDKFMKDILPECTSVELFLENRMQSNFVTLTTANNPESKQIFKWNNNYSWTFAGNLAGKSQIKEAVKTAGGAVTGVLRFSIMWAEGDGDNSDLDAHCKISQGDHIYYSHKRCRATGGVLDIDITQPQSQMPNGAVENITWADLQKMRNGTYQFYVHQFAARGSRGFKAEIEFNDEIFSYEYNKPVSGNVQVAVVTLNNGEFNIEHKLPETNASKEIYGLETNQFHKVNLVCLSPNHWEGQGVGNKHFMFMLEGAKTPQSIRSFHNENLIPELAKHRKVLEVLGTTNMLEPKTPQLTGLGFNATVADEAIVKLSGNFKRMLRIKFK